MDSLLKVRAGCSVAAVCLASLCGCASHRHDDSHGNARQTPRIVGILTVAPATAQVDNSDHKKTLKMMGGLASVVGGAIAGNNMYRASMGTSMGLSITYTENGQTFSSIQNGRLCDYAQGDAVIKATSSAATRIEPNAACPTLAAK